MTNETIKEIGKLGLDLAKITFAIAILTPFIKTGNIDYKTLVSAFAFAISGAILINKGTKTSMKRKPKGIESDSIW